MVLEISSSGFTYEGVFTTKTLALGIAARYSTARGRRGLVEDNILIRIPLRYRHLRG
jgi:hypothetical protein